MDVEREFAFFYFLAAEKRNKDEEKKEGEDPLSKLFFLSLYILFKVYIYLSIREDYLSLWE